MLARQAASRGAALLSMVCPNGVLHALEAVCRKARGQLTLHLGQESRPSIRYASVQLNQRRACTVS